MILLALACIENSIGLPETAAPPGIGTLVPPTVVPPFQPAEAPVYANTSPTLFEIDPLTGDRTVVGDFHFEDGTPVDSFLDIAIDLDGQLIGGTFDALYRIDPATAEVELLCETEVQMLALAFDDEGHLFAGGDFVIRELDTETCESTELLEDVGFKTSGDLVGLPDGYLYWTVEGEDGDELVRVDPRYGYTSWVGVIGVSKLFGVGYDDGTLFGFGRYGEVVAISPEHAGAEVLSQDEEISWWGATTNPVLW